MMMGNNIEIPGYGSFLNEIKVSNYLTKNDMNK